MASTSKIEWTDSTFNPWMGCTKVSPACDHCYASVATPTRRFGVQWGAGKPRHRTSESNWNQPLRWNAKPFFECLVCGHRGESAERCEGCHLHELVPTRRRVFCASLADVFDNEVPTAWREDLFDLIAKTPNLDWLLLTKRIGNVSRMLQDVAADEVPGADRRQGRCLAEGWVKGFPPANVWLGTTICNQPEADRDVPRLLAVPARTRFLSMEPLLGPVEIARWLNPGDGNDPDDDGPHRVGGGVVNWVIVGGESGPAARPMLPIWARSLRDQCEAAGTAFIFKQWGEWAPAEPSGSDARASKLTLTSWSEQEGAFGPHEPSCPSSLSMARTGKARAGRALDGRQHTAFPKSGDGAG